MNNKHQSDENVSVTCMSIGSLQCKTSHVNKQVVIHYCKHHISEINQEKSDWGQIINNQFTFVAIIHQVDQTFYHLLAAAGIFCFHFSGYFCHLESKVDKEKINSKE